MPLHSPSPCARHPPCPLPLPLAHAIAAKKSMPAGAPDVVPVFITLDPRRDSCAQVGAYVKDFHSRMVGESWERERERA